MVSALIFIGVLVGLILIHELGHFAAAKFFKIKVEEFGIFFPPRLASVRRGETVYSINWLPIGGFVRIFGEDPDESTGDPRALGGRSRWVQATVVFAGVFMNFLFAWLLLSAGYMAGLPTSVEHEGIGTVTDARPMVVAVLSNSPAQRAGIAGGDVIGSIETGSSRLDVMERDADAMEVQTFIAAHAEESLVITVLREGEEKTFLAKAEDGVVEGRKAIGMQLDDVGMLKLPVHEALVQGAVLGKNLFIATAQGLGAFFGQLFSGKANFNQVSGPIGIVSVGGTAVEQGLSAVLVIAASISLSLGVLNLVPIPGLDGGRLFILAVEGITRRRVPTRVVTYLTLLGFALLITLMVVVSYHDIAKLIG